MSCDFCLKVSVFILLTGGEDGSSGEYCDPMNPDDNLSELEKLEKYAQSDDVYGR